MAKRSTTAPQIIFPVPLPLLFKTLVEWDSPFTTDEVSGEFNTSDEFTTPALGRLWDAELLDCNDGQWTVAVSTTVESAEYTAREALHGTSEPVEETPKPTTPAQRFKARKAASAPVPAAEPIKGSDGQNVTVPVDFDNPENGRRELDASKGERVLSEDNMRELVNRTDTQSESEKTMTETVTGSWINDGGESHMTPYTPSQPVHPGHTRLPEPEFMDAPPEGVTPNFWELYKGAATVKAREFWGKKVAEEMKRHALMVEEEAAQEAAPVVYELPIDPVTGEPFPF